MAVYEIEKYIFKNQIFFNPSVDFKTWKKAVENVEISRRMGIQKLRASKSAYLWPFLRVS